MKKTIEEMSLEYAKSFKDNKETRKEDFIAGAMAVCNDLKALITQSHELYDAIYAYEQITHRITELTENNNVENCNS